MVGEVTPGIWPPYREFYIQGILFCTASALRSLDQVNRCLERLDTNSNAPNLHSLERRVLDELQNMVNQGGALSRYFWPANKKYQDRAAELRQQFLVGYDSPLKCRGLRNALEHFDERLDLYLQGNVVGYVFPEYVGPMPESDGVPSHIFRAFYTDVAIFQVLGERYEVEPIATEIHRIHGVPRMPGTPETPQGKL